MSEQERIMLSHEISLALLGAAKPLIPRRANLA